MPKASRKNNPNLHETYRVPVTLDDVIVKGLWTGIGILFVYVVVGVVMLTASLLAS